MHQRKHFPLSALEALSIIDTAFVDNKKWIQKSHTVAQMQKSMLKERNKLTMTVSHSGGYSDAL